MNNLARYITINVIRNPQWKEYYVMEKYYNIPGMSNN